MLSRCVTLRKHRRESRVSRIFKTTMMGKFILGDCMDLETGLPSYPDKFFDLAIVDPPYGISRSGQNETFTKNVKHKRRFIEQKGWDTERPKLEYWQQLFRCSKNQIVWGANYFTDFLPPSMGWVFWDKGQDLSMSDGELAFSSFNKALRRAKLNRCHVMYHGDGKHPTQKPVKLYRWLLENYAKPGQLILDTHVGSASSLIACESMGFDYVGFEIDPDYYAAAKNRMSKGIQGVLI
jgi:site-specific DNA-methyltransferase (adenine-specific)